MVGGTQKDVDGKVLNVSIAKGAGVDEEEVGRKLGVSVVESVLEGIPKTADDVIGVTDEEKRGVVGRRAFMPGELRVNEEDVEEVMILD